MHEPTIPSTRQSAIYLITPTTEYNDRTFFRKLWLRVRTDAEFAIKFAAPEERWNSSQSLWYVDAINNDWGMVLLSFDDIRDVCILFYDGQWSVALDPVAYKTEIALVSMTSTRLSNHEISNLFNIGGVSRTAVTAANTRQEVRACVKRAPSRCCNNDWELEVSGGNRG